MSEDEHVQGEMQGKEGQVESGWEALEWEHQPSFVSRSTLALSAVRYDGIVHRASDRDAVDVEPFGSGTCLPNQDPERQGGRWGQW